MIDLLRRLPPLFVTGLVAVLALRRLDDWDTWWHLAAGRWIAQQQAIPATDVLSFTAADHRWINLQWLYDVILYGLYSAGGVDLLVVISAATFTVLIVLCIRNLRLALGPAGAAAMALWVTAIAQERFSIRPEMVSLPLVVTMLWLFASARRDDGRRLWFLPLIMLVWANTHSLFIIGVFIIACHVAAALAAQVPLLPAHWRASSVWAPAATRRVVLSGLVAMLVPILNPYGIAGALFPLKLFGYFEASSSVFAGIGEGRPPFSGYYPTLAVRAYQVFFFFSVAVVALAALLTLFTSRPEAARGARGRDGRFDLSGLLLFAGFAYLSLLARRNMNLFALAVAPFVGECLLVLQRRLPSALRRAWDASATVMAAVIPAAVVAMAWFVVTNGFYRWNEEIHEFGTGVLEANFPIRAANFIKEMQLPGHVYNDLALGGYLTWAAPVPGGVYIDGRLPEVYGSEFFAAYSAGLADPERWQQDAERLDIRTVVLFHRWSNRHQLIQFLQGDDRWVLVYLDESAIVFVREAGNDDLTTRAQERFGAVSEISLKELLDPDPSWQWPVGRVQAMTDYADLLDLLGASDAAVKVYSRLVDFNLTPASEADVQVHLATYYADKGDLAQARLHFQRAAEANPQRQDLAELRTRLGS